MSDWRKDLLGAMEAPTTPGNLRFLSTWQRWEGGHTNNDAKYNWLNTTKDAPGALGEINSVGVKKFASYREGINAQALTIQNGRYQDIVAALRSGKPYTHDLSAGLSTWVSGSPTGNLSYAQKIMGRAGNPKEPRGGGGKPSRVAFQSKPKPVSSPLGPDPMAGIRIAFADDPEMIAMMEMATAQMPKPTPKIPDGHPAIDGGSVKHPPLKGGALGKVVKAAASQIGKPYVFGSGPDTSSFDCSDLIQWAYAQIGIKVPRVTYDQINAGAPVKGKLQPGDLVFPSTGHVVMYIGNGKVISAPRTGQLVQYQDVPKYIAARRILSPAKR